VGAAEKQARQEVQLAVKAAKVQLQQTIGSGAAKLQQAQIQHASALDAKEREQQALFLKCKNIQTKMAEQQEALESNVQSKQTMEEMQAKHELQLLGKLCLFVYDKFRLRASYRAWNMWARSTVGARIANVLASCEERCRLAVDRVESVHRDERSFCNRILSSRLSAGSTSNDGLLATIRTNIQQINSKSGIPSRSPAAPATRAVTLDNKHYSRPPGPPIATFPLDGMLSSNQDHEVLSCLDRSARSSKSDAPCQVPALGLHR
jgi:hypothetical protein